MFVSVIEVTLIENSSSAKYCVNAKIQQSFQSKHFQCAYIKMANQLNNFSFRAFGQLISDALKRIW